MRATALLQRLPHPADTEPRRRPRRHGRKRVAPTRAVTSPASDMTLARARLAGGPIDNASYTCSCGFVFAASVSTTVACPHCGASQAW